MADEVQNPEATEEVEEDVLEGGAGDEPEAVEEDAAGEAEAEAEEADEAADDDADADEDEGDNE